MKPDPENRDNNQLPRPDESSTSLPPELRPIEEALRRAAADQPPAALPAEWREQILTHARQEAETTKPSDSPDPNHHNNEALPTDDLETETKPKPATHRPGRRDRVPGQRAWLALAAIWLLILGLRWITPTEPSWSAHYSEMLTQRGLTRADIEEYRLHLCDSANTQLLWVMTQRQLQEEPHHLDIQNEALSSQPSTLPTSPKVLSKPELADPSRDVITKPRVPDDVRELAQEASEHFANGRLDQAAEAFQAIIKRYPKSLYAWSNLGVVRYQQKRYEEASQALEEAIKLSPADGFSYAILGIVYYQSGKLDDAIQILTRAKALEPDDAQTRNYLGIAAAQKGWQESAEKELRKAIQLTPNYGDAHFNLAVIYLNQKPPSKVLARKHYNIALSLGVPPDQKFERLLK